MKTSTLFLVAVFAALIVIQSSAKPCEDQKTADCGCDSQGESYVKLSKSSKSDKAASDLSDSSSEIIKAKGGEFSKESNKDSKNSASSSSDSSSESIEIYKAGAAPCGDSLPPRNSGECDEDYYKRIFKVNECDKASVKAFYAKVFKQYKDESNAKYVERIDVIFKVYKKLDCRTNIEYKQYLQKYYVCKYSKNGREDDEQYFERTITKTKETEVEYTSKVTMLKEWIEHVDWSKVKVDYKSKTGYILVKGKKTSTSTGKSVEEDKSNCKCTITKEEVKKTYAKKTTEDITTYYKRIVEKSSSSEKSEAYVHRITTIREIFTDLPLWYDIKYLSLVEKYYTAIYTQQSCETKETYFKRIVTKESFETEEQCAKRVDIVRHLHATLELWHSEKYYETLTKKIYSEIYKKRSGEDESTYYKRICAKSEKETDTVYVGRMILIQKTCSAISLWYTEKYISIIKVFYTLKYAKKSCESVEDYYKRLVAKEACDTSNAIYAQRMHIVHTFTVSCAVWYDATFYEKYTKSYYTVYYKKGEKETCDAWLTRVIKQLTGECEENAINRLKLINKSKTGCNCWTSENIKKLECSKIFTKEYLDKVWKVVKVSSIQIKKSSSACKGPSASESEDVTIVKRGKSC